MWRVVAVFVFVGLILGFTAQDALCADVFRNVRGIVENATEKTITVRGEVHSIVGVQIFNSERQEISPRGLSLIGNVAEISYHNGVIIDLIISPVRQGQDIPN